MDLELVDEGQDGVARGLGAGLGDSARLHGELRAEGVPDAGVGVVHLLQRLDGMRGGEQLEEVRKGAAQLGHGYGVKSPHVPLDASHRLDVQAEPPRHLLVGQRGIDRQGGDGVLDPRLDLAPSQPRPLHS